MLMGERMPYKVKAAIELRLSEEDIEDIVVTALNGGIGYWACLDNSRPEFEGQGKDDCVDAWTAKILMEGKKVVFIDEEDEDEEYILTLEKLLNGIKLFVENGYDRYGAFKAGEIDLCNFDAECADCVFQLAMFGELVFG